jgi:hypothetical protein
MARPPLRPATGRDEGIGNRDESDRGRGASRQRRRWGAARLTRSASSQRAGAQGHRPGHQRRCNHHLAYPTAHELHGLPVVHAPMAERPNRGLRPPLPLSPPPGRSDQLPGCSGSRPSAARRRSLGASDHAVARQSSLGSLARFPPQGRLLPPAPQRQTRPSLGSQGIPVVRRVPGASGSAQRLLLRIGGRPRRLDPKPPGSGMSFRGRAPILPGGALFEPGGFHAVEHRWALAEAFQFHQELGKVAVAARGPGRSPPASRTAWRRSRRCAWSPPATPSCRPGSCAWTSATGAPTPPPSAARDPRQRHPYASPTCAWAPASSPPRPTSTPPSRPSTPSPEPPGAHSESIILI